MAESVIPVRGANGLNLLVSPSDPGDYGDLMSCQNVDLSMEKGVQPRRGLARVTVWNGLTFDSNGDLRTGEPVMPAFGRSIVSMVSNVGTVTDPPAALGV